MSDQSSQHPDPQVSEEELVEELKNASSYFIVLTDQEGNMNYRVDWQATDSAIIGIASIFFSLMFDRLSFKIFEEIKQQCVLNDAESDYLSMLKIINELAESANLTNDNEDNKGSVVIPPDQSIHL
jgi:hypothetical protein